MWGKVGKLGGESIAMIRDVGDDHESLIQLLDGGNSSIFSFSPLFGEDEPILTDIFQMGWLNHQLEKIGKGWNKVTGKDWNKKVGKKTKTFSFL